MTATTTPKDMDSADRVGVIVILIIGAFLGGFIAATGLIQAVFGLIDPSRHLVALLADIPLEASGVAARAERVIVTAEQLPAGVAWALAGAQAISALIVGVVTVAAASVLWRVAQRRPFHRSVRLAAVVAGTTIALGSLIAQGLGGIATMAAADALADDLEGLYVGFEFEPLSVIIGLAILALAYIFSAGERLQRDTEGLV